MDTYYLDIRRISAGYLSQRDILTALLASTLLVCGVVCVIGGDGVVPDTSPKAKVVAKKRANSGKPKVDTNSPALRYQGDPKAIDTKEVSRLSTVEKNRKLPAQEMHLDYSYVGEANISGDTLGRSGKLSEHAVSLGYAVRVPINDKFGLRIGMDYDRIDFSRTDGLFLPQNLQKASFSVMLNYALSDKWSLFAGGGPTLGLVDNGDISSDNFSFMGMAGATYRPNDKLMIQLGLAITPDISEGVPVIPITSLRWQFAEHWDLKFGMPKTSLNWQPMTNLRISLIEAQFKGGSYRTASDYGTKVGLPDLNDRKLNYMEVRVGTRVDYNITENIELNLGVGASVYRKFSFDDLDNASPNVDPAPYVQAGVKIGF
ncbi:MAG: DUF6268 family outer membrane beta-barrel protein [Candidatus Methylacidiphilales bacterium]|nr:DUF6268 family outer membrane beta-barrel protein [Candidatus Methylacidiphilales bacterium]